METERGPSSSAQKPSSLWGLLGILAFSFAAYVLSKLRAPGQDSSGPQHPQDSTYDTTQIRQNIPSPVHVILDASPPTPTPNKERESREERQEGRDKKRFRVEITVAVVLAIYTVFTAAMWRATKNAADAAKSAANTASKTLLISEQAHVTVGRPDGAVAEIIMPNSPKDKAGVMVYFQNSGRIPAKFNWGSASPIIVLPADPNAVKESQYTSQWLPFKTEHEFSPMWRAKNRKTGGFGWSGTITIAGNSTYEGILWELPKERMLQLMNWDRPFTADGEFDYCDGFGHHLCRKFSIVYIRSPYNRFVLKGGDECAMWEYQVLKVDTDWDYLPPCEIGEAREELRKTFSNFPKP